MNDSDRRRYEMLVRVGQFGVDNAADFTGIATTRFADVSAMVNQIDTQNSEQQAGFGESAQQYDIKDTVREDLRDEMSAISQTAKSMEYEFDGIGEQFKFQRNMPDVTMLGKARAFATEAVANQANFIAYGLPATFIADLTAAADAFEATFANTASATAEHVEATAQISANVRQGMIYVRTLEGIVKNVYVNNPGKLAAWASASHVEKPPKKADPPPPPTP